MFDGTLEGEGKERLRDETEIAEVRGRRVINGEECQVA